MELNHINIRAPLNSLLKEKEFFCNLLGFKEGYRPDFSNKGYWLYAQGYPIVHLTESDSHVRNENQGYFDHIAFQSSNLMAFIKRLDKCGIEYSVNYVKETKVTQVFLTSSLGIDIEVDYKNEIIENAT